MCKIVDVLPFPKESPFCIEVTNGNKDQLSDVNCQGILGARLEELSVMRISTWTRSILSAARALQRCELIKSLF